MTFLEAKVIIHPSCERSGGVELAEARRAVLLLPLGDPDPVGGSTLLCIR